MARAWVVLLASAVCEAVWATALSRTKGFTRWRPTVVFGVGIVGSMVGLAIAMLTISTGTAYAVWVGIGTVGAVVVGILRYGESARPLRLFFVALVLAAVVGLKLIG